MTLWDWGDYFTVYISNVARFGDWLENNTITVDTNNMDYGDLQDLAYRFADGFNVPADESFPTRFVAERKAARRDEYRSVLRITPADYLASLDDECWKR